MADNIFVDNPFIRCPECKGVGKEIAERNVMMSKDNPYGYIEEYERDCRNCDGLGEIEREYRDG
jgi:Zn-finger nucleic acid-binding protein